MIQKTAFAIGVLSDIYGFHPYTRYSIFLYHAPACQYQRQFRGWAPGFHPWLNKPPTDALRPVNPNNACTLRITAAAGTKLAGAFSVVTVIIFATKRTLQPEGLLHSRGMAGSEFPPLPNILSCCLPFPVSGVCGISVRFQTLFPSNGQFPTRYSLVRH